MRASPRILPTRRSRRGLSLVEIMLATVVLAVVMIPILNLIFGGLRETTRGRDQATAVSLATNIMTQLLDKVPFEAFKVDDAAGPLAKDPGEFFQSANEGRSDMAGTRTQVVLESLDSQWERILDQDDNPGDGERTIVKDGTSFEVILYGGIYDDVDETNGSFNKPNLSTELTFSYFRNPVVEMDGAARAAARKEVVLTSNFPYQATGSAPGAGVERVDDPRFQPGWPDPGSDTTVTGSNWYKGPSSTFSAGSEDPNEDPEPTWPRHTLDLRDFREDRGAMLKLVLGLRWKTGSRDGSSSDYTGTTKEFWLVSFKAKLEES